MSREHLLAFGASVLSFYASPALASTLLQSAESFAVLGSSAIINTGDTNITGNLGIHPGNWITGMETVTIAGTVHTTDAVAEKALLDVEMAYGALASMAPTDNLTGQDLGGLTLTPGVYFFATDAELTGTLTLDAQGMDDPRWVFQVGSGLTTASASTVVVTNLGDDSEFDAEVFWQVGRSANLGESTEFVGSIVAYDSITLNTNATIMSGRAMTLSGVVSMDTNIISIYSFGRDIPGPGFSDEIVFNDTGHFIPVADPIVNDIEAAPTTAAPEPATLVLAGFALFGLGAGVSRRARV